MTPDKLFHFLNVILFGIDLIHYYKTINIVVNSLYLFENPGMSKKTTS